MKSVYIQSFSDPHFPAFELNTDIYEVTLRQKPTSSLIAFDHFVGLALNELSFIFLTGRNVGHRLKRRSTAIFYASLIIKGFSYF